MSTKKRRRRGIWLLATVWASFALFAFLINADEAGTLPSWVPGWLIFIPVFLGIAIISFFAAASALPHDDN